MRLVDADALKDWLEIVPLTGDGGVDINDLVEHIDLMPSAQPQRMRGRWLELTNTNHTYICSICGRMLVNVTDGKNMVTKNYPFCHCGADMRGGEQDDR